MRSTKSMKASTILAGILLLLVGLSVIILAMDYDESYHQGIQILIIITGIIIIIGSVFTFSKQIFLVARLSNLISMALLVLVIFNKEFRSRDLNFVGIVLFIQFLSSLLLWYAKPLFMQSHYAMKQFFKFTINNRSESELSKLEENGFTPLMMSIFIKSKHEFDNLLKKNIDVNVIGHNGNTALHYAIFSQNEYFVSELMKIPQIHFTIKNEFNKSAIDLAEIIKNPTIKELVLNKSQIVLENIKQENEESEKQGRIELDNIINKLILLGISSDMVNNLTNTNINRLNYYIDNICRDNVIVLIDNKIKMIENERWQKIMDSSDAKKYQFIYK